MSFLSSFGYYGVMLPVVPALVAGGAGHVVGSGLGRLAGLPFGNKTADRLADIGGGVGAVAFGAPVAATTVVVLGTAFAADALVNRALGFGSAPEFRASRSAN